MLSIAGATLDSLIHQQTNGKYTYSLPRNFENICDNGKAYHFLVPWFISKQLVAQNINKNVARKITLAIEWAYQSFSTSLGRNPEANAQAEFSSFINQANRLDLVHAALGADYGATEYDSTHKVNMQSIFDTSEDNVPENVKQGIIPEPGKKIGFLKLLKMNYNRLNFHDMLKSIQDP